MNTERSKDEIYDFYSPVFGDPENPNKITGYKTIGGDQDKSVAGTLLSGNDLSKLSDEKKSQRVFSNSIGHISVPKCSRSKFQ